MSRIVVERVVSCTSDVCSVWNVLTDTERMNRAIGNERVAFTPLANGTAARFLGKTTLGGFDVEYEERPYEWEYLRRFRVERRMRNGPIAVLEMDFRLAPRGEGTDVTLHLALGPRLALLAPIVRFQAKKAIARMAEEVRKLDEAIAKGGAPPRLPRRGPIDDDAIARAEAELRKSAPAAVVEKLVALVRDGSDFDVSRIRPFALADEWGLDRQDVLSTMLRAVRAGLLELRWELVCPSCRVATEAVPTLAQLREHGACQLCELDFGLDVDEAVEATFAPAAAIREVDTGPYCIGGPARVPHVVAQTILPSKGVADLVVPNEPGRYRAFVRGGAASQVEVTEGAPAEASVAAEELGGEPLHVAPGGRIRVANAATEEKHAKLERAAWASKAATAREVTALPAFRRDFSSDVLRPGASLKISRVALFFSDLTASTELYSAVGDAAAFKLVQDHFDVVISILEAHHGSLVKTIGDAVMAVFASEEEGLVASAAILREFELFRRRHPNHARTHIKLGLYAGPCYVVTANGILDYFGQSVNIAARLQAQAQSGELVVEEALAERGVEKGIVLPEHVKERWEAKLKGVAGGLRVARVALA